ncbi:hypothetical protein KP79_PYT02877 [Mizuhopecten yessoensis]|uniref:Uncharacterized protein n=1 Tax=Mizuhopecten yessoensis TaxID=6573 RepID=A0A210PJV7_MIZYE|nr:hypothetical protein KP79_PYT02877 [Mizuhopecten yessoensis]
MVEDNSDSDVDDHPELDEDDRKQGKCSGQQASVPKQSTKGNTNKGSKSWSKEEQEAVFRHLGQQILTGKLPGKHQCEEVKRKEVILHHRSWE